MTKKELSFFFNNNQFGTYLLENYQQLHISEIQVIILFQLHRILTVEDYEALISPDDVSKLLGITVEEADFEMSDLVTKKFLSFSQKRGRIVNSLYGLYLDLYNAIINKPRLNLPIYDIFKRIGIHKHHLLSADDIDFLIHWIEKGIKREEILIYVNQQFDSGAQELDRNWLHDIFSTIISTKFRSRTIIDSYSASYNWLYDDNE